MNRLRTIAIEITVLLLFGLAMWLRVSPPFNSIFTPEGVRFSTVDAYYHMYVVDNLAHNFPKLSDFLPYLTFPGGHEAPAVYFFNWLLAATVWVVSLGKPTPQLVDVIGAYYPAVLGALTIFPVYFIGKAIAGRWGGLIAAAIIAVLPGEFIGRSILGSTDQHVAESLITTIALLFLILALKAAKEKNLSFAQFKERNWKEIAKPVIFSLLAGFFLGLYFLTWLGALLFVFIIGTAVAIQFIIEHLRGKSTDYLALVYGLVFFVAALMILPVMPTSLNIIAFAGIILGILFLYFLSILLERYKTRRIYYPSLLILLVLVVLGGLFAAARPLFDQLVSAFAIFHPTGASLTTLEMQPILVPTGTFTLSLVWGNFTASFFISFLALMVLIFEPKTWKSWVVLGMVAVGSAFLLAYSQGPGIGDALSITIIMATIVGLLICMVVRQTSPEKSLLVVWGLIILVATIGQRRFAYYYAVNAAVLTGYFCAWLFEKGGLLRRDTENTNELLTATLGVISVLFLVVSIPLGFLTGFTWIGIIAAAAFFIALFAWRGRKFERKIEPRRSQISGPRKVTFNTNIINMILAVVIVFLVVLFPNVTAAKQTSQGASFAPTDGWMEALTWMQNNTPDPFDNPNYYYEVAKDLNYPASAYGVLSWWDYGYWITRIAHRIPNVNPSQDAVLQNKVGKIFTAQTESEADELARQLVSNYVVIDDQTALGKFWAVATWAGKSPAEFSDMYYLQQQGQNGQIQFMPVQLYSPEYYRSFAIRLYNFDGKAHTQNLTAEQVTAVSQWLVSSQPAAPASLSANATRAGLVSLNWTANTTGVSGFRIDRSTNANFGSGTISIKTPGIAARYDDPAVDPATTYYYRVFAFNQAGESAASSSIAVTTPSANNTAQVPAAPAALNATAVGSTMVTVSWKDNSESETGFRIDRSTTNSFLVDLSSRTIGANITTWTDTSVSGNTTYYYRIAAYNDGGNSPVSNTASVNVPGGTTDAPTLYAANCASCHGPSRQGSGNNPAITQSALAGKSGDELKRIIADGTINGMPGFQTSQVFVITYDNRQVTPTQSVKIISDAQPFDTYAAASEFLKTKNPNTSKIVGPNPFVTPVPIEAIKNYKLVYGSTQSTSTGVGSTAEVKVFQYTGNASPAK